MEIKIIGSNCSNGMKLYKMATRAVEELNQNDNIHIEKLDDRKSINKYGIKDIPGLVINNKLVSQGKVLSQREISRLLA